MSFSRSLRKKLQRQAKRHEEVRPVTSEQAARRALRAMALGLRAFVELGRKLGMKEFSPEIATAVRAETNQALIASPYWAEFPPAERDALVCGAGLWEEQQHKKFAIEHEVAATLLWALQMLDALPPPFAVAPGDLTGVYQRQLRVPGDFVAGARLRSAAQLELARDTLMLWCARGQMYLARSHTATATPLGYSTWDEAIAALVGQAAELKVIRPLQGDFPAGNQPYRELSPNEAAERYSTVAKRYETLCWLTGARPVWEQAADDKATAAT